MSEKAVVRSTASCPASRDWTDTERIRLSWLSSHC